MDVLGSPSLIVLMVSGDVKQHGTRRYDSDRENVLSEGIHALKWPVQQGALYKDKF